ncbi:MAG: hypothetical protein QXD34_02990 [Candidatus Bathyarchaeia archaeon]|nr:hypothetical protein [Candidatus Bathyarchaeota archaeon]
MCGKTFSKPLKVENLSSGTPVFYEACPYCLTEITMEKSGSPATFFESKPLPIEEKDVRKPASKPELETVKEIQQTSLETPNCKHHFGYLSERSSREWIPEECIICPKIVQCMLKGVTA